jgi:CO/xanthine dehydrogenase FAD-binding subunit
LEIAATCKIIELDQFTDKAPKDWAAAPLLRECCRSFLSSFKIWNEATVGGNICMSLPAGPMISLTAALEGIITLWPRGGKPREVRVVDFVTGVHQNVLQPGELIRSILLPASAMQKSHVFRRFTLTHLGRSEVLIVGTQCRERKDFLLTVTAATLRPMQFVFESVPSADELRHVIESAIPFELYLDDTHGSPAHRRHLTYYFSEQIRQELSA